MVSSSLTESVSELTPFALQQTPVPLVGVAEASLNTHDSQLLLSGGAARLDATAAPATLILDFGQQMVGYLEFEVDVDSPATLHLFYGEDLIEARREDDYIGGWYHLPHDEWRLEAGHHRLQPSGRRAFRFVRILLEEGNLNLAQVKATLVHYPVERRGTFECSDPQINRIWEIGEHTTRLCMQQYFEDGVKRDGLLWIGDYRVQYLCAALLYADTEMARRSLQFIANSQFEDGRLPAAAIRAGAHQHPSRIDYMMDFRGEAQRDAWLANWKLLNYDADYISSVREYLQLSGDTETVRGLWPSVLPLIEVMADTPLDVAYEQFITDDQGDSDGWWSSRGALFLQRHQALRDAEFLAQVLGDEAIAARCGELLQRSAGECATFFSSRHNVYCDENPTLDADTRVSWHSNAFAVLSGLSKERSQLLKRIEAVPDARYPVAGFMEFYRLQATFEAGLAQEALDEIRRYWGHMLKFGATSCWDCCDPDRFPDGIERPETHAMSHCHGWSAGPAYLLPTYVLGVKSVEPGFARIEIEPQLGDLTWAQGIVPTPHGDIAVRWDGVNPLRGTVVMPTGIEGEVVFRLESEVHRVSLHSGENSFVAPL